MGPVEVVEVLPPLQLVIEEFFVIDNDGVGHSAELFFVDGMRLFHLSVESWGGGFDVDMSDTSIEDVVVNLRL